MKNINAFAKEVMAAESSVKSIKDDFIAELKKHENITFSIHVRSENTITIFATMMSGAEVRSSASWTVIVRDNSASITMHKLIAEGGVNVKSEAFPLIVEWLEKMGLMVNVID